MTAPLPAGGRSQSRPVVLVVGSYPPVATAGTAVTLETVRRLHADGARPVVASPRASAAEYDILVAGPLAGRRLDQLRAATGAEELVFCAERDFPIPASAPVPALLPALQRLTVENLARSLAGFRRASFVVCGDAGVADTVWQPLRAAGATVELRPDLSGTPGVTALGPDAGAWEGLARRAGGRVARRVLGSREPAARRVAGRALRKARGLRARG